jgi:hypothetical protein
LAIIEAIAMATGRNLLGIQPPRRLRVWYVNLEDPREEIERRIAAVCLHYRVDPRELEGQLFFDGREIEIILAEQTKSGTKIAVPVVEALITALKDGELDALFLDPFVSAHRVAENDNNAIDTVSKTLGRIAGATNCAIERATALHEAGHAVAGFAFTRGVPSSVSLERHAHQDRDFGAAVRFGVCEWPADSLFGRDMDVRVDPPEDIIAVAAQRMAGQAAEFLCDQDDYRAASSLDETVEADAVLLGLGQLRFGLSTSNAPAFILLTRAATWQTLATSRQVIERAAAQLITKQKLDQPELANLLADVSQPEPPIGKFVISQVDKCIEAADGDVRRMIARLAAAPDHEYRGKVLRATGA